MDSFIGDQNHSKVSQRHTARDMLNIVFRRIVIFIGIPLIVISIIFLATEYMPKIYEARAKVRIEESSFQDFGLSGLPQQSSELFQRKDQFINSEINVAKSTVVIEPVVRELELWKKVSGGANEIDKVNIAMAEISDNLSVSPVQDSWDIEITYKDSDPKTAAKVANAIAKEYIQQNINLNKNPEAAPFYLDKLTRERAELERLQQEFLELKSQNLVSDFNAKKNQLIERRASYETSLTNINTEIINRSVKIEKIQEFLETKGDVLIPIPEIANARIIEDLNYRLVNMRLELDSLLQRYTEEERQVKYARAQIQDIENQLRSEVEKILVREQTELKKLRSEAAHFQSNIRDVDRELLTASKVEGPYNNLEAQIRTKQDIVANLDKLYTDKLYAGESDLRLGRVKLIDPAKVPRNPAFPNLSLNLILGIPIALLLGLSAVLLLEYFDRTFSSSDRVKQVLDLPVLATINEYDTKKNPLFQ